MAHAHLAPQELQSVEDQLDLFVDLFTWFGTAKDITVQQYADAVREFDVEQELKFD